MRASHAAAESIGHTSEWLQQEARARLQALVEQSFVTAEAGLGQKSAEASQKFEAQLAAQSTAHLGQIRAEVESVAGEVTGRARTELDRAAEAAAASFGEITARGSGTRDHAVCRDHRDHAARARGGI